MAITAPALGGGNFYGSILRKQERHDAIFTDLQHLWARKLPTHSHELAFFALQLQGDYREQYGRQVKEFGALTIAFRPAGIPHQDEVGPRGVRLFEIEIRPSWQKRLEDCSGALDTACDDCAGGELLWLGMKLFFATRASLSDDLYVQSLVSELVAKVGRMPRERAKDAPSWLHRVLDKLHSQFCERLTLDELGEEAGVHPVHLSRVFRKCVGEGIGEYVHRLRIQAACGRISVPGSTLAEVAAEAGFADQSHFTRAFRRVTGMSPGAFRTLMTTA
jgi:AraC family transcriptional regulator